MRTSRPGVSLIPRALEEFYQRLGHKVADELVDWFNQVDITYRSEFRELFELEFARFDAKLEQRLAEAKAELQTEFRKEIADLRVEVRGALAALESRLIRWMVGLWVASTLTLLAAMFALVRL